MSENVLLTAMDGPSPAMEIARDLAKRAVWIAPAVLAFGAFWGTGGVASTGYALVIVAINFLLAAWMLAAASRISFAAMAGAAMFGYILRLGLIFLATMAVKDAWWMELLPFGLALIATHLILLFWELRFVSGSYAYPGLKPTTVPPSTSHDRDARAA